MDRIEDQKNWKGIHQEIRTSIVDLALTPISEIKKGEGLIEKIRLMVRDYREAHNTDIGSPEVQNVLSRMEAYYLAADLAHSQGKPDQYGPFSINDYRDAEKTNPPLLHPAHPEHPSSTTEQNPNTPATTQVA